MKILFVGSELNPLAHTGGLGDVMAALPAAIRKAGHDARIIMPLYKQIKLNYQNELKFVRWSMIRLGWRTMYSGLFRMTVNGVPVYLIDNEYYFGHDVIYLDYAFDIERFSFFQRAVLEALGEAMDFTPDILHLNDWQSAMIPVLLEAHHADDEHYRNLKTVLTIHNLKYQGVHGREQVQDYLELPNHFFSEARILQNGVPNFLKAGIVYSDKITVVSPTYSEEILTDYYGEGLNGILGAQKGKLKGILNGLDTESYDPATDKCIAKNYDVSGWKSGKAFCRKALEEELSFNSDDDIPLMAMVTRLTDQKGLDLLLHIGDELLETTEARLAIIGTGDADLENRLRALQARHPDKMRTLFSFEPEKARRLYAASDIFLMPSLFEPCGLSQMIAMRYGSLPVVRQTGGLKDTVHPYNRFDGSGNGFGFLNINAHELLYTTKHAVSLYEKNPGAWGKLVETAMMGDYSWMNSAQEYISLYKDLMSDQKDLELQ